MTDANVVQLHDPRAHARAVRARLWNPRFGRHSSELDVFSGAELRKRQLLVAAQNVEQLRADEALRRELLLDAGMRNFLDDYALTKKIAAKIEEEETAEPPRLETIIKFVAGKCGSTPIEIKSQVRANNVIWPRFMAMYLARTLTFRSTPEIGRAFGKRDHTTILNAVKRVKARMAIDAAFKEQVEGYQRELSGE